MLGGWLWLGTFAYKHVDYTNELWWKVADDAPRFLRSGVACASALLIVLTARMLRTLRLRTVSATREQLDAAAPLVAESERASAALALLGDKSLLFDDEQRGFVMYAVEGRTWVSLGDPVGPKDVMIELLWRFRDACDAYAARSVFYQVPAEHLPYYLDLGLSLVKFGEEARVPLEEFTLQGREGKRQRKVRNAAQRDGLTFELLSSGSSTHYLAELKEVSDAWVDRQEHGGEGVLPGVLRRGLSGPLSSGRGPPRGASPGIRQRVEFRPEE